jgi:uncharacterized membrane protein YccC
MTPENPMRYDWGAFLNGALAILAGAALAVAGSAFFLPADPDRRARRLIRSVCGEVEALAGMGEGKLPTRASWESRMYDRLSDSMPHLSTRAEELEVLDSAFAALQIGASFLDLKEEARNDGDGTILPVWRETVDASLATLRGLGTLSGSGRSAGAVSGAAWLLLEAIPALDRSAPAQAERRHLYLVRTAASLEGIALLLADQGPVFHRVCQEVEAGNHPVAGSTEAWA